MNMQTEFSNIKIQKQHLDRIAIIYIRQSTVQQIERHQESTKLQYALKDYAKHLGWSEHRILIIDSDLGLSGATSEGRPGFQQLVSEVSLNHVGLVLGIEMSRLARSCKDWHQLLEVCAIFDTLIGDAEGIYNPLQYNDRLLLGLKGTMSEAELHIIKSRLLEGKRAKAKRGELGKAVPIGYIKHPSGEVRKDPDEQARSIVELLFSLFERLGTIQSVLRYLVRHKIEIPFRSPTGVDKGELQWRRPNRATLRDFFHNPIYAGAYVYGRRPVDVRKKKSGRRSTGRITRAPDKWSVLIKDKLPAYISWEQYERNLKQIEANKVKSLGAIRKGPSLLSGLLVCGQCGRRMTTHYANNGFELRYACTLERALYEGALCQSLKGKQLDEFIEELVLDAMKPAALEISIKVAENIEAERKQLESNWKKSLERAHYETEKSRRHYHNVDPENRLVARTLEREWEEKLAAEETLKNKYHRFLSEQPTLLSDEEKKAICQLSVDIPRIWNAPTTSNGDRQAITRQLIEKIILKIPHHAELVQLQVYWKGGNKTEHEFIRPVRKLEQMSYFNELEKRVKMLYEQGYSSQSIADSLNENGWSLPRGGQFKEGDIRKFLVKKGLVTPNTRLFQTEKQINEWTVFELAQKLEVSQNIVYGWIRKGNILQSRKVSSRNWLIQADENELLRLRTLKEHLNKKQSQFNP